MEQRKAGKTDLDLSILGLGTMTMGWSCDRVTSFAIMNAALEAHLGGSDEEALGGDVAYRYGMLGRAADPERGTLLATLKDPRFGEQAQGFTPVG